MWAKLVKGQYLKDPAGRIWYVRCGDTWHLQLSISTAGGLNLISDQPTDETQVQENIERYHLTEG